MKNANALRSLTYGMDDVQLCNVKANIQYRAENGQARAIGRRSAVRVVVVDALQQERSYDSTMPLPSPAQMVELAAFAAGVGVEEVGS
jgi:hypothetical protein